MDDANDALEEPRRCQEKKLKEGREERKQAASQGIFVIVVVVARLVN